MAVTPQEAMSRDAEEDERKLKGAEQLMDALLRERFSSGYRAEFKASEIPFGNDPYLRSKLFTAYLLSGWSISHIPPIFPRGEEVTVFWPSVDPPAGPPKPPISAPSPWAGAPADP